jgi:glycosyltransferase involved in cell wall biosynthesis
MLKAADALHEDGYEVRVVCTNHVRWARDADAQLMKRRPWKCVVVDYERSTSYARWIWTGARHKLARTLIRGLSPHRVPMHLAGVGLKRAHSEIVRAVLAQPCDLVFAAGRIFAAAAAASRVSGAKYAVDLEDFLSGENADSPEGRYYNQLSERLEREVLGGACFVIAASDAIAKQYRDLYDIRAAVVNNTFPLPNEEPRFRVVPERGLRLYWFSQTIGPRRGLEDAIRAMGRVRLTGELHLRGNPAPTYPETLRALSASCAPHLKLVFHRPESPELMTDLARQYDVGLCLEPGFSPNNRLALSNKSFTYLLAGLAVVFTDTPGQRPLALDLGEGAILYQPGDIESLAQRLRLWAEDGEKLLCARRAAWEAARRRWHWEHPKERGTLLEVVAESFAGGGSVRNTAVYA